jgi:hypothetical protein
MRSNSRGTLTAVERVGHLWDRSPVRAVFTTVSVIVLVAGLVVFLSSRNGAPSATVPGPAIVSPPSATALYGTRIPLPPQALATARRFIQTAVLRAHVGAAWALATPKERGGLTRAQWDTGDIPVVPYARKGFSGARFTIARSRQHDILIQVLMTSHTLGVKPSVDFLELVPSGSRWLVSYWAPRGENPPVPAAQP